MELKRRGKVTILRGALCKKALEYYRDKFECDDAPGFVPCQWDGHYIRFNEMTPAHQIGRPHIKPGPGEALTNLWCLCAKHHNHVDTRPKLKSELMEQGCNIENGRILK